MAYFCYCQLVVCLMSLQKSMIGQKVRGTLNFSQRKCHLYNVYIVYTGTLDVLHLCVSFLQSFRSALIFPLPSGYAFRTTYRDQNTQVTGGYLILPSQMCPNDHLDLFNAQSYQKVNDHQGSFAPSISLCSILHLDLVSSISGSCTH